MNEYSILSKAIKKPSVTSTVMERIYESLLYGEIKPGELLPSEAELSEQMNVGKSSVREAIKMLNVLGIVESIQGEGTRVRTNVDDAAINPMTYQMLLIQDTDMKIMELRHCIEPAYTLLAMKNATEADIQNIQQNLDHFAMQIANHTQTAKDDIAFHEAILEATHNQYIIRIGRTILQLFEASIQKSMTHIPEQALKDHRDILAAIIARDEERVMTAVNNSFKGWQSMLQG